MVGSGAGLGKEDGVLFVFALNSEITMEKILSKLA